MGDSIMAAEMPKDWIPWTDEEERILREERSKATPRARIAALLGRSVDSIAHKAARLDRPSQRQFWTQAELRLLKKLYPRASWQEMFDAFPRWSRSSIRTRAEHLGLQRQVASFKELKGDEEILARLSETDCAYLAGIIDGEGSLDVSGSSARLYVGSTSQDLVRHLESHFGGKVRGFQPAGENLQFIYHWRVSRTLLVKGLLRRALPYLTIKRAAALELLGLPADSVILTRARRRREAALWWTPEEEADLVAGYEARESTAQIAAALGRSVGAVVDKAKSLGLPRLNRKLHRRWTERETTTLERLWGSASWRELETALPRHTRTAISGKAEKLRLTGRVGLAEKVLDQLRLSKVAEVDFAHLAGIIDGEGSIVRTGKTSVTLSVGTTSPELRDCLVGTFGGSSHGAYPDSRSPGKKYVYTWQQSRTATAREMLRRCLPYLVIKRAKAESALVPKDIIS